MSNISIPLQDDLKDTKDTNERLYVVDPLKTIIKLSILSCKPIGTKLAIMDNTIYIQEPGVFQGITRKYFKCRKSDLHYLYNPIYYACRTFMNEEYVKQQPRIVRLFERAILGLQKLKETYRDCSIIQHSLNHYISLVENYTKEFYIPNLFKKDNMSDFYTNEFLNSTNDQWNAERIKILLDLIEYICINDTMSGEFVKNLEVFVG
jgi:hypothetical protein